jgi:ABC-type transport system involved in multi-copper enzyme maturation permease subunit
MLVLTRSSNPVERIETKYQQRHIPAVVRRWWLVAPVILGAVIIGILLTLREIDNPTRDLAIYAIWLVQIITAARALAAGASAISREHHERTWDTLVMTGISARQILLGKLLGVMYRVAPWMFALGAMRLIMLPVLMLAFVNRVAYWVVGNGNNYSYYSNGIDYLPTISWVAWAAMLAVVMTVVLTMLDALCCAAIGLAASAVTRRSWLALIAAFCVRFAPVVIFGLFSRSQMGNFLFLGRILRYPPLALADGGSGALYQLVVPVTNRAWLVQTDALPGLAMTTGLFLSLLGASLVVAWAAIRASGALPKPKAAAGRSVRKPFPVFPGGRQITPLEGE